MMGVPSKRGHRNHLRLQTPSPPFLSPVPAGQAPMASVAHGRLVRPSRAPPPTPIATGKGTRSAAANDIVLTEYLEKSLRVPEISLPDPSSQTPSLRRRRVPEGIDLGALLAGTDAAGDRLRVSAASVGAFRIDGHGVSEADVSRAMEVATEVFGVEGERREELRRYLRRRGDAREEFRWVRSPSAEEEAVLRGVWLDSYATFREKLENICTKLDKVAECVGEILSTDMGSPCAAASEEESLTAILCLRKYSFDLFRNASSTADSTEGAAKATPPHALSLHLLGWNREFVIQTDGGAVPFPVPGGSLVVTLNKDFQALHGGALKGVDGEPIFELSSDLGPSFSLEYTCTPASLSRRMTKHTVKSLSLKDQLLVALAIILLFRFWVWLYGS